MRSGRAKVLHLATLVTEVLGTMQALALDFNTPIISIE